MLSVWAGYSGVRHYKPETTGDSLLFCGVLLLVCAAVASCWLSLELTSAELRQQKAWNSWPSEGTSLRRHKAKRKRKSAVARSFATASNKERMDNSFDLMYTGSVAVGTEPQHFSHMVFDTGSADLWVMDAHSKELKHKSYIDYFESSQSSSYGGVLGNWGIVYGGGAVDGHFSTECVALPKVGDNAVCNLYFGLATRVSDSMSSTRMQPMDGILGFGMRNATSIDVTHFRTLPQSLNGGVFTFFLSAHLSNVWKHARQHSALFMESLKQNEELRSHLSKGPLYTVAIESEYNYAVSGLWALELADFRVDGFESLKPSSAHRWHAILDTGTSYLTVPTEVYFPLMKQLKKQRADCSKDDDGIYTCLDSVRPFANLPDILLSLRDLETGDLVTLSLSAAHYMAADATLALMPVDANIFILGDTFLRKYVTTFDEPKMQATMAESQSRDSDLRQLTTSFATLFSSLSAVFAATLGAQYIYLLKYR